MVLSPLSDKAFEDDDSGDGGRSSSSSRGGKKTLSMGSFRRTGSSSKSAGRDGSAAGAVDDEDFIQAFEDVPTVQIHSNREVEENMTKIRDVLSDDKKDWELRVAALKKVRSLLLAGASDFDAFPQQLRLMEAAFKLSAKDLRSQVVREACLTMGHLSLVLGSRFDHAAEAIMPILITLVSNSAKIMASSGTAAIRLILKHTHYPRLIPVITSNCTCKSVAVRRRCFEFLEQLLQEWQSSSLRDMDSFNGDDKERDPRCRRRGSIRGQKVTLMLLQMQYLSNRKCATGVTRLISGGRRISCSRVWRPKPPTVALQYPPPPALQRSRSDVDVNAASSSARGCPPCRQPLAPPPPSPPDPTHPWKLSSVYLKVTLETLICFLSRSDPENDLRERFLCDGQPGAEPRENLIPVSASTYGPRTTRLNAGPPLAGSTPPGLIDLRPRGHRARAAAERPAPAGPPKAKRSPLAASCLSLCPPPTLTLTPSPEQDPSTQHESGLQRETSRDTSPARGFSPWRLDVTPAPPALFPLRRDIQVTRLQEHTTQPARPSGSDVGVR
ncbi:hypothetical protein F7725_008877 [Dissostichus mawsoni]|uniref:CLASP N-terminal domain-containing protein n=1 Tax=Dissostichus mawsoni TaxID=36200 RepID=A0A7J5Z9I9_DISMA|nr:hypothetical protein F7725_008877 [Dissostichus mawsoni]